MNNDEHTKQLYRDRTMEVPLITWVVGLQNSVLEPWHTNCKCSCPQSFDVLLRVPSIILPRSRRRTSLDMVIDIDHPSFLHHAFHCFTAQNDNFGWSLWVGTSYNAPAEPCRKIFAMHPPSQGSFQRRFPKL